mmetsp:Transcript_25986/g.41835  ORF Transcript_25986/g.41835 Transcript_25986/m.41835 type:complete len:394 (+) Transcript_25986:98-1279(+)
MTQLKEVPLEAADLGLSVEGSNTAGHAGECSICLDIQKVGDLAVKLACGHFFHKRCIGPWIKRSAICPTCRNPISSTPRGGSNFAQRKEANKDAHRQKVEMMARMMREMEEEERKAQAVRDAADEDPVLRRQADEQPSSSSNDVIEENKGHTRDKRLHKGNVEDDEKAARYQPSAASSNGSTEDKEREGPDTICSALDLDSVSVKELKRRLKRLGVDSGIAIERRDLSTLLNKACSRNFLKTLTVKELKQRLRTLAVDHKHHVVMKSELVDLLFSATKKEVSRWGPVATNQWHAKKDHATCNLCSKNFSLLRHKHHCRYCGRVVCSACSKGRANSNSRVGHESKNLKRSPRNHSGDQSNEKGLRICIECSGKLRAHAKIQRDRQSVKNGCKTQ